MTVDDDAPAGDAPSAVDAVAARAAAASRGCTRWLSGHGSIEPAAWLSEAAAAVVEADLDRYGAGGEVGALEREVAALLGKAAAVFMPSGIMAQQAALRAWVDRSASDAVAVHGLSHLVRHELDALPELHRLRLQQLTREPRPATVADLDAIDEPLAAVTLELPLRDAGYLLPSWEDLVAFSDRARELGIPLHVDGARIWEAQPFYDRTLAEIAALADSIYVSFYKGLGGMAGAIVAGPVDLVAHARRWQTRHGGRLFVLLPYAVLARHGLAAYLPKMSAYRERAIELAHRLDQIEGVRVFPITPHTNAFRLFIDAPVDASTEAGLQLMEREHVAVSGWWMAADVPGWSMTELTVGDATFAWDLDAQVATIEGLVGHARELAAEATAAS